MRISDWSSDVCSSDLVPVRADLAATIADLAGRQARAVYRPVELGRERLEARLRRFPRPEALLQGQAQRLDEISERLRRALMDRAGLGRERLAGVSARLSPRLLAQPLASKRPAPHPQGPPAPHPPPDRPWPRGNAPP